MSDSSGRPLSPDDVRAMLEKVRSAMADSEAAHGYEDDMFVAVLSAIAEGRCDDPKTCAALALEAQGWGFDRWYA